MDSESAAYDARPWRSEHVWVSLQQEVPGGIEHEINTRASLSSAVQQQ